MGTPNAALTPGDILRGVIEYVDPNLDACFISAGSHGRMIAPLDDLDSTAVARLKPGAQVCAQLITLKHGEDLPSARLRIEFSGRSSVLVLDGTCFFSDIRPTVQVHVSHKLSGVRRAELASKLETALQDESCGLTMMLDATYGPINIILRSAADTMPWDKVLSALVVQATEAAALATIARLESGPALLMAEKPDSDGDVSLAMNRGLRGNAPELLVGKKLALSSGGEIVFERTRACWGISVETAGAKQPKGDVAKEAAIAIGESLLEFNVIDPVTIVFPKSLAEADWQEIIANLKQPLSANLISLVTDPDLSCICLQLSK
ncbi:MAG: hypothetical protein IKE43_08920 [Coriobacteriales bacterium]|nr:hypothetical protein [Coriobacteriales bacterium]